MTEPTPQRVWRMTCSFCGAPVELKSPASVMAVCSYCKSTLLRDGDSLRRVGQTSDVFHDHSPLSLGCTGRWQARSFVAVGRVQWSAPDEAGRPDGSRWTEWNLLFDDGRTAWLSEDNGTCVVTESVTPCPPVPQPKALTPGASVSLLGTSWTVTWNVQAECVAAQGELSRRPDFGHRQPLVELRNPAGEVMALEWAPEGPEAYRGQSVALADLGLLAADGAPVTAADEGGEKRLVAREAQRPGRGVECPHCGSAVEVKLSQSVSVACGHCHAVITLKDGELEGLAHHQDLVTLDSQLPLGCVGRLSLGDTRRSWQVVGVRERRQVAVVQGESVYFWREYLLYNQTEGFAFLTEADEQWTLSASLTGAPKVDGERAQYKGTWYKRMEAYEAITTAVLGEFYWRVQREERSLNVDYQGTGGQAHRRLYSEATGQELHWSAGRTLRDDEVRKAFGLPERKVSVLHKLSEQAQTAMGEDVTDLGVGGWLIVLAFIGFIVYVFVQPDECDRIADLYGAQSVEHQRCLAEQGSGSSGGSSGGHGGSYGGYSSGGFHK